MSSDKFGLELMFRVAEDDIQKKDDVLIVLIHWFLTKYGFRCIGLGDDRNLSGSENGSEVLPRGWSEPETYTLRYVYDNKLYILRSVRADDTLIVNLLYTPDLSVSNLTLNVTEVVPGEIKGPIEAIVPSHDTLLERVRKELVEPIAKSVAIEATTQTPASTAQSIHDDPSEPRRGIDTSRDHMAVRGPHVQIPDPLDPFGYGQSDLDPLAVRRPGGGMVFDPFRGGQVGGAVPPGGIPRGRVPGARFDPIAPPGIGRPGPGFGPNPDHMPPPGYDDMFM